MDETLREYPHRTLKTNMQFIAYVDQDKDIYIGQYIANKFDIPNRGGKIIKDGLKFVKVFQDDINNIIDKSRQAITPIYKDYQNRTISVKEDIKKEENENLKTIYYYHSTNDKYYLNREGYEISKKYEVEIEGKPIIIEGNRYSITINQLNTLKDKTKEEYIWKEKDIEITVNICKIEDNMFIPLDIYKKYKDEEDRKLIIVNKELFIKISKEDLKEIELLYSKDGINISLIEKKIQRIK